MARDRRHAELKSAKGGWLATACEWRILGPSFRFGAVVQLRCGEILVACRAERAKGSPKMRPFPASARNLKGFALVIVHSPANFN